MSDVITTSWGNEVLGLYFGTTKTLYVALFTADPTLAGSLANEVAGGSYARQPSTFSTPSGKTVSNNAILSYPNMPACSITHIGICKTLATASLITYASIPGAPIAVASSAEVRFEIGDYAFAL